MCPLFGYLLYLTFTQPPRTTREANNLDKITWRKRLRRAKSECLFMVIYRHHQANRHRRVPCYVLMLEIQRLFGNAFLKMQHRRIAESCISDIKKTISNTFGWSNRNRVIMKHRLPSVMAFVTTNKSPHKMLLISSNLLKKQVYFKQWQAIFRPATRSTSRLNSALAFPSIDLRLFYGHGQTTRDTILNLASAKTARFSQPKSVENQFRLHRAQQWVPPWSIWMIHWNLIINNHSDILRKSGVNKMAAILHTTFSNAFHLNQNYFDSKFNKFFSPEV